jgi:hypothetical protein
MIAIGTQIAWTAPNGNVEIIVRRAFEDIIQVIERPTGAPGIEINPFPATPEGEIQARALARAKAEIIRYNQTGK